MTENFEAKMVALDMQIAKVKEIRAILTSHGFNNDNSQVFQIWSETLENFNKLKLEKETEHASELS